VLVDTGGVVRSPLQTALLLLGILTVAVIGGALGLPQAAVVLFASTIGGGLLVHDANRRRESGARAAAGSSIDGYPLQLPAERYAVGRLLQLRLAPPTRHVWAPGLLCIRPGEARFVPSKDKHRARAWAGPVTSSEVLTTRSVAVVRLHGPEGSAQFAVQAPPPNLEEAVPAWLGTTSGGAAVQ
jgi:hypothetical protein